MKNFRPILIIIIILSLAISVYQVMGKKNLETENTPEAPDVPYNLDLSPDVNAEQLCYIWNTEAGDKAMISMDIRGSSVIGEFYFFPAEKDSKTGIFKGTVSVASGQTPSRRVDSLWDARAEGTRVTEELWILFGEGIAQPGFGGMRDRGDGVYVYADPEKIFYGPNLQETDCGDEAMD